MKRIKTFRQTQDLTNLADHMDVWRKQVMASCLKTTERVRQAESKFSPEQLADIRAMDKYRMERDAAYGNQ